MRHSLHTAQYCTAAGLLTLRRVKVDQIKIKTVLGVNHHHLPILTAMKSSGFMVKKIALIQFLNSRFCSHFVKSCDLSANNAKVKDYAKVILNQKIEVLNLISCEDYSRRVLSSSTIGAHMRHSLDHFNAVLNANAGNTVLDYDSRERNTDIESIRLSALRNCENLLQKVHESTFDDPVTVKFTSNPTTGKKLCPSVGNI